MTSSSVSRSLLGLLAAALLMGGCASLPVPSAIAPIELTEVPFFPQREYQCGPAALATVLTDSGLGTTPDELVAEVYVEGLRGSLQAELLGATRRHQRIPVVLEGNPDALFAELSAGRPVLVLQNLALAKIPVWHYAVVIGYDGEHDDVILRSGTERRRRESLRRFLRSWDLGGRWGFVTLRPGELPAGELPIPYMKALTSAEPLLPRQSVEAGFAAALERWPAEPLVLFAAAEYHQTHGKLTDAAALYRRLLVADPQDAAARNNLANVLAAQGCHAAALREARAALASTLPDAALYAAISDTVSTIERTPEGRAEDPGCL